MFKAYKIDPVFGELSLGTYSGGTGSVTDKMVRIIFLLFIRNQLKSSGLEPVLIHTKKLCLASYYIQFSTDIKNIHYKSTASWG